MPVASYLDVHIPRAIPLGLRVRQVDVLTAQEDHAAILSDLQLLDRATALKRVLFSFDRDFLTETMRRQEQGLAFSGLVYAHPLQVSIGACIRDQEIIAKVGRPEDFFNRVQFLPL
jgi:hypothetical protein